MQLPALNIMDIGLSLCSAFVLEEWTTAHRERLERWRREDPRNVIHLSMIGSDLPDQAIDYHQIWQLSIHASGVGASRRAIASYHDVGITADN
ncbi:Large ribosomal subunit protein [Trichinella pseudospiralis]